MFASHSGIPITSHGSLPGSVLSEILLHWPLSPGKLNTLIIYDLDAPYPANPSQAAYLHGLIVNIPNGDIQHGDVLMSFTPPNPPKDSPAHRYVFAVYAQEGRLALSPISQRENFDVNGFVMRNRLQLAGQMIFDGYWNNGSLMVRLAAPGFVADPPPSRTQFQPQGQVHYDREGAFLPSHNLSESEEKYCHCVLEVAAKQPAECNLERAWFQHRDEKVCYNPYAVCASRTHTSSRHCGENYNFAALPDEQIRAYANLSKVAVPEPYDRTQMLTNIMRWKESEGK